MKNILFLLSFFFFFYNVQAQTEVVDPNTVYGQSAGKLLTTGVANSIFGPNAGFKLNQGYYNTFIGRDAGYNTTNGNFNVFIGASAGNKNIAGVQNVAVGVNALYDNTSSNNIAIGNNASFKNTTGSNNLAIGTNALFKIDKGEYNIAIGNHALENLTYTTFDYGTWNIAIGANAGFNLTEGTNNIFIGTGVQPNICNTCGGQLNIGNWIYGRDGKIGIGYGAEAKNPVRAYLVVDGARSPNFYNYGFLNSSGSTGTASGSPAVSIWASDRVVASEFNATSDMRIKRNIKPLENNSIALLNKIKVVNYIKLSKGGYTNEIGVIAQDVEKILPLAVTKSEGDIYNDSTKTWEVVQDFRTVNYQSINLLTTKAVQELSTQTTQQQQEIEALIKQVAELEKSLQKIISTIKN
jgi:hypothetical protein